MLCETALSCCLLLLASGSCLYLTGKWLTNNFIEIQPEIVAASIGVFAVNLRSVFNLLSPLILHNWYPIDPIEILEEDQDEGWAELRVYPLNEKVCRVLGTSGLLYAVFEAHKCRKSGIFIIFILIATEVYHAMHESYPKQPRNRLFHFTWMLVGGTFGYLLHRFILCHRHNIGAVYIFEIRWLKDNPYCMWAFFPYGLTFLCLTPERDMAWSPRRLINNYMMMIHVFLILEAIREARSLDLQ